MGTKGNDNMRKPSSLEVMLVAIRGRVYKDIPWIEQREKNQVFIQTSKLQILVNRSVAM